MGICNRYIDIDGTIKPLSDEKREEISRHIQGTASFIILTKRMLLEMASRGLRTLALTFNELDWNQFNFGPNREALDEDSETRKGFAEPPEKDLVLNAIVGIKVCCLPFLF